MKNNKGIFICLLIILFFLVPAAAFENLSSDIDGTFINFSWDYNVSFYRVDIFELIESAPYADSYIILDGIKDACYDICSHAFVLLTPNPQLSGEYEVVYWFRNNTHLIGYADGFDDDVFNNDDSFRIGIDNTGDGLTIDDRKFILNEDGTTEAKRWGGSSWLPTSTNAQGVVVGQGVAGAIQYEIIIPLYEMDGFVDGVTAKFFMERRCTSLNPDISTFFPNTLINTTDASLWANAYLTIGEEYEFVGNTTDTFYNSTGLTHLTWYKHQFIAVNATTNISTNYSRDITRDVEYFTVSGTIFDDEGNPVENASVWSHNGIITEATLTNESGFYIGYSFVEGNYSVHSNKTGYYENCTDVYVTENITNLNMTLTEITYTSYEIYEKLLEIEELLTIEETAPAEIIKMTYQIFLILIIIDVLLIWYSFTKTDVTYYTDIITSLLAIVMSALLAYNSIIGVSYYFTTQSTVHEILYTSIPLAVVFISIVLMMLIFFITKILDLTHRELDLV